MYRKNLKFKSTILKVFILYLVIYLFALFLRYSNILDNLLIGIEFKYLIFINIISITLGLPLSILFDLLLIKFFGLIYIIFFTPVLALLGYVQVLFFRKTNIKLSKTNFLLKKIKNNKLSQSIKNFTLKPTFILLIRTFPILPFTLGSFFIASSDIKKRIIFLYSLAGGYFYYFSIFLIMKFATLDLI